MNAIDLKKTAQGILSTLPFGPVWPAMLRSSQFVKRGLPWITTGAREWLERNVTPEDAVLEFGGGGSTVWWSRLAGKVVTVEASHEWCQLLLEHMRRTPELLKKWRLVMAPCDWNPDFDHPKGYWQRHAAELSEADVAEMEHDYLTLANCDPTVCFIDGSIRTKNIEHVASRLQDSRIRVLAIDNTEAEYVDAIAHATIPASFQRIDFPADQRDVIPEHQGGRWQTSVWRRQGAARA